MNQKQVEEWIARNGGERALQYDVETEQIDNPAANVESTDYVANSPKKIEARVETWTNRKTGATLKVRRLPSGDFAVIADKGADPTANEGPPRTDAGRRKEEVEAREAERLEKERDRNEIDFGLRLTNAEMEEYKRKRADAEKAQKDKEEDNRRQAERDARLASDAEANRAIAQQNADTSRAHLGIAQQQANKPSVTSVPQDNPVLIVKPDGTRTWERPPEKPVSPGMATLAELQLKHGEIVKGLYAKKRELQERVASTDPLRKITPAEADAEMKAAHAIAEAQNNEIKAIYDAQVGIHNANTQWATSQQATANNRLSAANAMSREVQNTMRTLVPMAGRGSGAAAAAYEDAMLAKAHEYAKMYGGLVDVPQPQFGPALQAAANMTLPGYEHFGPTAAAAPAQQPMLTAPVPGVDYTPGPKAPVNVATPPHAGMGEAVFKPAPDYLVQGGLPQRPGLQMIMDDPWYDNAIIPELVAAMGGNG